MKHSKQGIPPANEKVIENLAIFIPTHNRSELLIRNLKWLQRSGLEIYIADSSEDSSLEKIRNDIKISGKINYSHYSGWDYYDKCVEVIKKIEKKYVIVCPDDDYILWNNIEELINLGEELNASCVIGKELSLKQWQGTFLFQENNSYRKDCILKEVDRITQLKAAMDPIVCTFYQLHRKEILYRIYKFMKNNKKLLIGNKLSELIFRCGCFLAGPVGYVDKILRVWSSDTPSLRRYDKSEAIQKYTLEFNEEIAYLVKNNLDREFINCLTNLVKDEMNISEKEALRITNQDIWYPVVRRMKSKHELLWSERYALLFDPFISKDTFRRNDETILWRFSLENSNFRIPFIMKNFSRYCLREEKDWLSIIALISHLQKYPQATLDSQSISIEMGFTKDSS